MKQSRARGLGIALAAACLITIAGPASVSDAIQADPVIVVPPSAVSADANAVNDLAYSTIIPDSRLRTGWVGSTETCDPGSISAASTAAALRSLNAYRAIVGVGPVTFDGDLSAKAQAAALTYQAPKNGGWGTESACATPGAQEGLANSAIHGSTGGDGLLVHRTLMRHPGESVFPRMILNPFVDTMGFGATSNNAAVYTAGAADPGNAAPEWFAWPPAGNVPHALVPLDRWMLSSSDPSTSFAAATVSMAGPTGPIPVTAVTDAGGYPARTLVWELTKPVPERAGNGTYTVTVHGVTRDSTALPDVTYQVRVLPFEPATNLVKPSIDGKLRSGSVLKVRTGTWVPSGRRDFKVRWTRDGEPIRNGWGRSYRLRLKDEGARIGVQVRHHPDDYASATVAVEAPGKVSAGRLRANRSPGLELDSRGTVKQLRVKGLGLNLRPVSFDVVWERNGRRVSTTHRPGLPIGPRFAPGIYRALLTISVPGHGSVTAVSDELRVTEADLHRVNTP